MRIVIDLQSNQSPSRVRGIGQYAISFTQAFVHLAKKHEILFILNGLLEEILPLRATLSNLVPVENIRLWYALPCTNYYNPQHEWRRKTAELTREALLTHLNPDMVLIMSLFEGAEVDAITSIGQFNSSLPTAVILYDLIPLLYPKQYLPSPALKTWYTEKLSHLKNADLLFAISEASRQEAVRHLALSADTVVNISSAIDPTLFRPFDIDFAMKETLKTQYGIVKPFILYVTAGDPRKNTARLIKAYGQLPSALRSEHQLVIVSSSLSQRYCKAIEGLARTQGIKEAEYKLCLQLPGETLSLFYNACKLFIFPSYHEGFGLPLLEAMACGKPVLGSNRSSIPEVIQHDDAVFDPFNVEAIAASLIRSLTDAVFLKSLAAHCFERAKTFSWEKTAQRALDAIETYHGNASRRHAELLSIKDNISVAPNRPKLAYVYCFDENASAYGKQHSLMLIDALSYAYEIDFIADTALSWTPVGSKRHDLTWFKSQQPGAYQRILYLAVNAPLALPLFDLMTEFPGVLLLHDFFLPHLFAHQATKDIQQRLYKSHGYAALLGKTAENLGKYPAHLSLLQQAINVFVPDPAFKVLANSFYGDKVSDGWSVYSDTFSVTWYVDEIENSYSKHHAYPVLIPKLLTALSQLPSPFLNPRTLKKLLPGLSYCIAETFAPPFTQKQLLLDISILVKHDAKTGVQRVVRAILWALLHNPPKGFRVEPIYSMGGAGDYRYARRFTNCFLKQSALDLQDDPIDCHSGDYFLSIDFAQQVAISNRDYYQHLRRRGICIYFIVYDLLPLELPHAFPPEASVLHHQWLQVVSAADGALCISQVVSNELRTWMQTHAINEAKMFKNTWFHLGADLKNSQPTLGMPSNAIQTLIRLKQGASFLMVGTIEPRKGYEQALAAFEQLWATNEDVFLVIIGKQGWLLPSFTKYLRHHPEKGKRLFWFEGISDEYMEELYAVCSCLLVASLGEGFGLPLIEAAQHHLPIIARDLPIFREVAGAFASYFQGDKPSDLSFAIKDWLQLYHQGRAPSSKGLSWLTWDKSVNQLLHNLSLVPAVQNN
ncbi:MAG: glycosyltransferase family 4 protein [Legionella sp.]|nr:glycosyltransferase family 4 protein [Legionella sp.]